VLRSRLYTDVSFSYICRVIKCNDFTLEVFFKVSNSILDLILLAALPNPNGFSIGVAFALLAIIILLFCSAVVSASEIAFFSLTPNQLKEIHGGKHGIHLLIRQLLERPKRLLATILISNNFVNVAVVIISAYVTNELFDFSGSLLLAFLIQVVVITSLILLMGEIMPKVYATQYAMSIVQKMARPMIVLLKIFYPLSSILVSSTYIIDRRISRRKHSLSMSDLSEAIDITSDASTNEENRKMLKSIARFGDIDASEIMKARIDVTAIDAEFSFGKVMHVIHESGYSRIPVYKETFDTVTGLLYIKDLLPFTDKGDSFNWQSLLRPAFFVPESKRINDLLTEFQEKKIHLAIVVDEYGGTSGIITLEDIIEEIVGEINDEFDSESDSIPYRKIDEHNYIFEGKTSLNDFCKITEVEDGFFEEVKGDADTLAGLVLELAGKIPVAGEIVTFMNYIFCVEAADKRRIKRVKVSLPPDETPDE
jgi:putative hemolysin